LNLLLSATPKSILRSMRNKRFRLPAVDSLAPRLQRCRFVLFIAMVLLMCGSSAAMLAQASAAAPNPTSTELWQPDHVPFSFQYDGKPSAQLLAEWQISHTIVADPRGEIHRTTYTDPATHLTVMADVRLYSDFPDAVDWVIRFRNDGSTDTPILENILPLDGSIPASDGDCVLRHARGSNAAATDFEPMQETFGAGESAHLESLGGDSSNTNTLPFFNLQTGDHGLVGAIGWTGNWKADFQYASDGKSIGLRSGMVQTHLRLHPGEEIRTPRIVLMRWSGGNWQDAQNLWRRLLFAHYTPQDHGKPMRGPILFGSWGSEPIADKLAYIDWVHQHKIPVEVYAVDAGWYGASVGVEGDPTNPWWKNRGDWFPSPLYYPNGIRPLGEALRADGFGFSLWIEPETTMPGKKIAREHPDWFLHKNPSSDQSELLANLGDPAARKGITDMVSGFIRQFGMTWYRQDFNIMPAPYWKAADTPDRIGMTEIGDIEGLYKMWDDLLAQHPGLRIDNCASGGRRLDIEMMSRSFSVWRTDHGFHDTMAEQAQTQALAYWVPQNMGFETYTADFAANQGPWTTPGPYSTPKNLYLMRLGYDAGYGVTPGAAGVNNEAWVAWIKQALAEYREVQPYLYGDFYPLLPYSLAEETWTAWQWDRPEQKDGLVIVLRRPASPFTPMELNLRHLQPDAMYEVEIRPTLAKTVVKEMKGSDLMRMSIQLPEAPSSTLVFYRQQ
jgi:alpha-galactosidase